jgi:hypothetical protein
MMDTEKEFERLIRDRALLMVLIGKVRSHFSQGHSGMMRAIAKHCCVSRAALKELAQIAFMGRVKENEFGKLWR